MTPLKRALTAGLLVAALSETIETHAATYYVATTGSNSNPGTQANPWQTVAYAVNAMNPGDTTYVRGGVYNEGEIRFRKSGSQSAPIKLLNAPGESPVIQCINPAQFHRIVLEHGSGSKNPVGWITVEGFEIRNCYDGFKFYNAHDLTIRKNWIHHNKIQGILGNGTRVTIDRNRINHNGAFEICATTDRSKCNKDHGIYTNGTAFTITNNLIYDNLSYGIQANGSHRYDSSKHAGPEYALSHNWVIANNTIAYNRYRSAIVVWGFSLTNLRIENNIFYENAVTQGSSTSQGIDFASMTSTGITIKNNLAYASGSGGAGFLNPGANEWVHFTQSGNIVNTENPRFVNAPDTLPTSPNFSLTSESPAIDKGVTSTTNIAFDGTPRPLGRANDIGAYEYNAGGDVRAPAAPASLQVN